MALAAKCSTEEKQAVQAVKTVQPKQTAQPVQAVRPTRAGQQQPTRATLLVSAKTRPHGPHRLLVLALVAMLVLAGFPFAAVADPQPAIPQADVLDVDFSGRQVTDLSPAGHSVTSGNGGIVYDDTLNKYVGTFNRSASDSFVIGLSDADYAKLGDGLTLELVFKAQPVVGGYNNVVCNTQVAGFGLSILGASSTSATQGTPEGYVMPPSGGYVSPRKDNGITYGQWTHAALVYDGSAVQLFINGQLVDSRAMSGAIRFPTGAARSIVIGGDITSNGGIEDPYLGQISTTRLYSEPLSAEQVAALAARDLAPQAKVAVEQVSVRTKSGQAASITTPGGTLALAADVLPLEADNRFAWSIASGSDYATLSEQGVLSAKANGAVTVRATASDGSGVYGELAVSISGQDGGGSGGSDDGVVRFGVISDTHVTATKAVEQQRLAKAFQFFSGTGGSTIAPVDTMVVVGDLTDSGAQSEMDAWGTVKDANLTVPLIANMGNHENNRWGQFEGATGNKANDVKVVNGYYFITLSPGSGTLDTQTGRASGNNTDSYAYAVPWLEEQLAIAEAASPNKPVFVFFHHPIKGTHYMSSPWPGKGLENVFKNHPRAVTFSGHLHSTNNLSTSIWQDGGYTTINTVTTSYMWLAAGMVYGEVPPNASQCAQGLLVEVDGSEVTVKNYDILADAWIDQTWNFDVDPDNLRMPYTTANMSAAAAAPVFAEDAGLRVTNHRLKGTEAVCDINFDQASIPGTTAETMGDIVYSYRYDFFNKQTGQVEESFKTYSEFYFLPTPETISYSLESNNVRLDASTNYELRVFAIDTFGNTSAKPLTASFRSAGPGAYLTLAGPTAATAGDTLDYTVSLGAVKDAGTIRVDVAPTGTLEFLEAASLDASGKLSVASTKKKADGTVSVILTATELPGITLDAASPILKLSFKATAEGQGSVTLTKAEGASYIYNGSQFENTADIEVALPEGADATITTAIAKYIDPYDFNRDDKVTLADLTYVQAFYMASEGTGGYGWEHAVERGMDLDASGTIDVADFILIIDHLYEIEA